jgi:CHAD domain-containing protein
MAARLEIAPGEGLSAALQRIIAAQALTTAVQLGDRSVPLSTRVHETRKRFKENRALLRLFRRALGEHFATENRWYRDSARELAEYRDADAVRAAVQSLPEDVRQRIGPAAMRRLRRVVRNEHRAVYQDVDSVERRLDMIIEQLPVAAARLTNLMIDSADDFGGIERDFIRTLRRGRRLMRSAAATSDPAEYHEWRKRVKEHWHQIQFLKPIRPKMLEKRETLLNELSHILGEYHDVQLIRGIVATATNIFEPSETSRVDEILAARQKELERDAHSVGKRVYKSSPKSFAGKLRKRWKRWAQSDSPSLRKIRGESSHSTDADPSSARTRTP